MHDAWPKVEPHSCRLIDKARDSSYTENIAAFASAVAQPRNESMESSFTEVRSLQHFAMEVPDPLLGARFYTDFGLKTRSGAGHIAMGCAGRDQDQVLLFEGARKRLHHLRLGTDVQGMEAVTRRLQAQGVARLDPPPGLDQNGLWFRDPDGHLVNIAVCAPSAVAEAVDWRINIPGRVGRVSRRGCPPREMMVQPRRLGHVMLFTPDIDRQVEFYIGALGMVLSDICPGVVAFLRCAGAGAGDHHVIALLASEHPGFHHASFEVANPDEIGVGASRMLARGWRHGWGFGRHVIGSNFFHYIRDPWNSLAEYFCDIDVVAETGEWDVQVWPTEDSLYLWGPNTPSDFGANYEGP